MSKLSDMSECIYLQDPSIEWHFVNIKKLAMAAIEDVAAGPEGDVREFIEEYIFHQIMSHPRSFLSIFALCLTAPSKENLYLLFLHLNEFVNPSMKWINHEITKQYYITEENIKELNYQNNLPRDRYED